MTAQPMWPLLFALAAAASAAIYWIAHRRIARLQTALRLRESELRREQEQHRLRADRTAAQREALLHNMVQGVLLLDPTGHVSLANDTLTRLFELPPNLQGRTVVETLRHHQLQQLADQVLANRQPATLELALPGPNPRHLEVTATPIADPSGQPHGALLMFHDLSRLKLLERTRTEFVANVSHELRTPLSMIKGYVETLLDGAKSDPAVLDRFLHTIEKHADRLTFLIEDLLTLSSLESGSLALNLRPIDLRTVLADVLADLHARAADQQVAIVHHLHSPPLVLGDADRLGQVLSNLLDNSLKYGRSPGQVDITASPTSNGHLEIRVQDDGPGIPTQDLTRIFERFYRVDRARSRDRGGTGLGLAIVKHIIQSHGGEAWATSTPGQGATFHFTLPLAPDPPP